jgi:hypothetical protein
MGGSKMNKPTPETDFAEYYIQGEGNYVRSDISRKLERERGEANTKLQEVSSKLAEALRERDEARVEIAKLRDIAEWAVDNIFHKCTEDLIRAELEEIKQLK